MLVVKCDISIKRGGFYMVPSMKKKQIILAISLLLLVISLTGVAMAAAPQLGTALKLYPTTNIQGAPGKLAQDVAGNMYVTDFWAQGVWAFDKQFRQIGFMRTESRPVG